MNKELTMLGNTQLNFGQALELLKQGKLVQRSGWNGKGMFLFLRPETEVSVALVKTLPDAVKKYYFDKSTNPDRVFIAKFTAYICMKAAEDTIVNGWLASQTDMTALDWVELGYL